MASKRSEDSYGMKVDRCLYNAMTKFVVGVGVGIVTAAVLRFKPWPIILGAGVGTGMGISDCNYEFKAGSLSKAVKNSLDPSKRKPAFVAKRKCQADPVECDYDEEEKEFEKREKLAGIVGKSSHLKDIGQDM